MRQRAQKSAQCALTPQIQARAIPWATWLKVRFRGQLVHPPPAPSCGFHAAESPKWPPRHPYQWSPGTAEGQPGPRMSGANGGSTRVAGAKKMIFSNVVPRPLGVLKQVFLTRFEPMMTCFGPCKIPKCLDNGAFQDQKWVKNDSKTHVSKSDPGPFVMLKQVFFAHLKAFVTRFGARKIPKCLANGPF